MFQPRIRQPQSPGTRGKMWKQVESLFLKKKKKNLMVKIIAVF